MIAVEEIENGISFTVRVVPRASKSEIVGEHAGSLKIRVSSPPVDGAANVELVKILAKNLGVSRADIAIVAGLTSKTKRIKIANLSQLMLREKLK